MRFQSDSSSTASHPPTLFFFGETQTQTNIDVKSRLRIRKKKYVEKVCPESSSVLRSLDWYESCALLALSSTCPTTNHAQQTTEKVKHRNITCRETKKWTTRTQMKERETIHSKREGCACQWVGVPLFGRLAVPLACDRSILGHTLAVHVRIAQNGLHTRYRCEVKSGQGLDKKWGCAGGKKGQKSRDDQRVRRSKAENDFLWSCPNFHITMPQTTRSTRKNMKNIMKRERYEKYRNQSSIFMRIFCHSCLRSTFCHIFSLFFRNKPRIEKDDKSKKKIEKNVQLCVVLCFSIS